MSEHNFKILSAMVFFTCFVQGSTIKFFVRGKCPRYFPWPTSKLQLNVHLSFWISWQYDPHSDEHHTERGWRRRKTLQRYSGVYIIMIDILTETDAVFYVLQNTFNKIQWWLLPQTEQTVLILALKKLCQILPSPHFIHILIKDLHKPFLRRRTEQFMTVF